MWDALIVNVTIYIAPAQMWDALIVNVTRRVIVTRLRLAKVNETAANNCVLILGDFIYPSIDWEILDVDNYSRYLLDSVRWVIFNTTCIMSN